MKITKLSIAAVLACMATTSFAATDLAGAFKEAKVDGKVRFNYFNWQWNDLDDYTNGTVGTTYAANGGTLNKDSSIAAIGGSLGIKTAPLYNISVQAEFFTSQPLSAFSRNEVYAKSGADLDLRDAFNTSSTRANICGTGVCQNPGLALDAINVLGIANVQYQFAKTNITLGKQYFDTPMTGTNDSKMVPNTFDGYTAVVNDIPSTVVTLGYIRKMKPRNQDQFVGLLDSDSDVNKGLRTSGVTTTITKALSENIPDYLGVIGIVNKSISNLELQGWFYRLDGILDDTILEANYKIPFNGFALTFGGRYMIQQDKLNGKLGANVDVASADGVGTGYTNKTSLNSSLYALRAILEYGAAKFQYGYSAVADKADILAPWRGFPTGGYTRPMKIENWDANIKSWMLSFWYDFGKAGFVNGLDFNINYLVDNRDESKLQPKGDMKTITADINYKFNKSLSGRLRFGDHDDKGNAQYEKLKTPKGWDFREYRAELNYKF